MTNPSPQDVERMIERLREQARQESAASKMLADAKTARQTDRDDHPELGALRGYMHTLPEETASWQAADMLAALSAIRLDEEALAVALGGYASVEDYVGVLGDVSKALVGQGAETLGEIVGRGVSVIRALSRLSLEGGDGGQ